MFVSNLHVRDARPEAVADALRAADATPAYITGASANGWISLYPAGIGQDGDALHALAVRLSASLRQAVIAFLVHDSDIFIYWLARNGELLDHYNSAPGYFGDEIVGPEGGDAALLLEFCLPTTTEEQIKAILAEDIDDPDPLYVFAEDRMSDLAEQLGIGASFANSSYEYSEDEDIRSFTRID